MLLRLDYLLILEGIALALKFKENSYRALYIKQRVTISKAHRNKEMIL